MNDPPPFAAKDWDACVVGAGPAGALVALRLAERGRRVLLVDKASFPRPKVCGGCLGGVGLAALEAAGLSLESLGVPATPLDRVRIHAGSARAELPLRSRRAISREAFDAALLQRAIDGGVRFVPDCRAAIGERVDERRRVRLKLAAGPTEARARVVLIAGGLGSGSLLPASESIPVVRRPASRIGAGATIDDPNGDYAPGEVTMVCGRRGEGYVGVAMLPDGRLDLAAAFAPAAIEKRSHALGELAARVLRDNGLPVPPTLIESPWSATPTLTQRPRRLGVDRVLLLGDAAGYVEPFTGEGIGWALRSALEVEPIASEAIDAWSPYHVRDWEARHHQTVGRWQRRCRRVCGLVGGRWATPAVVRLLSFAPNLASPVLKRIDPVAATL